MAGVPFTNMELTSREIDLKGKSRGSVLDILNFEIPVKIQVEFAVEFWMYGFGNRDLEEIIFLSVSLNSTEFSCEFGHPC